MKNDTVYGHCPHGENMANCMQCNNDFPLPTAREMKTNNALKNSLDWVKNEVAQDEGFDNWMDAKFKANRLTLEILMDLVSERYSSIHKALYLELKEKVDKVEPDGWIVNGKFFNNKEQCEKASKHAHAVPVYLSPVLKEEAKEDETNILSRIAQQGYMLGKDGLFWEEGDAYGIACLSYSELRDIISREKRGENE